MYSKYETKIVFQVQNYIIFIIVNFCLFMKNH